MAYCRQRTGSGFSRPARGYPDILADVQTPGCWVRRADDESKPVRRFHSPNSSTEGRLQAELIAGSDSGSRSGAARSSNRGGPRTRAAQRREESAHTGSTAPGRWKEHPRNGEDRLNRAVDSRLNQPFSASNYTAAMGSFQVIADRPLDAGFRFQVRRAGQAIQFARGPPPTMRRGRLCLSAAARSGRPGVSASLSGTATFRAKPPG